MAIDDWYEDQRTGQPCPWCGSEIVYNGNYFCSGYTFPEIDKPNTCDWAMPEDERGKLFDDCLTGLMHNREKYRATAEAKKKAKAKK
jgi:hypothetical protein